MSGLKKIFTAHEPHLKEIKPVRNQRPDTGSERSI